MPVLSYFALMTKLRRILLVSIGLLMLYGLYRLTAPPGLTWQHGGVDGGELAVASNFLGPAHPPGYALYILSGWFFLKLPLAETPIVRLQIMSHVVACFAVLTVGYTAWLCARFWKLPRPVLTGWLAAIGLALNRLFWSQAIIVEVYTLLFLFFVLTLACALRLRLYPTDTRLAFICGFIQGMAIAHHLSAVLWLPGLVVLWHWRHWRFLLIGLVLGLWPILLLALLGGHHPAANWGGINQSLQALWNHITSEQYRVYVTNADASAFLNRLRDWFVALITDFAVVGVVALVIGMVLAGVRSKRLLLSSLFWMIPLLIFTTIYTAQDTAGVYSGPLHTIAAIWIAFGLAQIVELLPGYPVYRNAAGVIIVSGYLVLLLNTNFPAVNLAQDTEPQQFLHDTLAIMPEEVVIITSDDQETFTLWYYHFVDNCCDGLVIVDRRLLRYEWYRENLRRLYPFLPVDIANVDAWLSDERLSGYMIVSSTFLLPEGGRQVQRIENWYTSPPAS